MACVNAPFSWREELAKKPGVVPPFRLDPERTSLVVVDLQNVTAARGYAVEQLFAREHAPYHAYYFQRIETEVVPRAVALLTAFRDAGRRVVHLTVGSHLPDGSDFEPLRRAHDERLRQAGRTERRVIAAVGSRDHAIIAPMTPRPDEIVLNKVTRSAFSSTGLDQVLRNLGVSGFVIIGVATNACVGMTACDGADRGYKVVMVEDATAAPSPILHEAALLNFAYLFGHVRTTREVAADLGLKLSVQEPAVEVPSP